MDAETRREELDKLRAQFYASPSHHHNGAEIDFGANISVTDSKTIITLGDDEEDDESDVENDFHLAEFNGSSTGSTYSNKISSLLDESLDASEPQNSLSTISAVKEPQNIRVDLDALQADLALSRETPHMRDSNLTYDHEVAPSPPARPERHDDHTFNLYINGNERPLRSAPSEDSEASDADFQATFTPSEALYAVAEPPTTESSGITLLSYQSSAEAAASDAAAQSNPRIEPVVKKRQTHSMVRRLRSQGAEERGDAEARAEGRAGAEPRAESRAGADGRAEKRAGTGLIFDSHKPSEGLLATSGLISPTQPPNDIFWDNLGANTGLVNPAASPTAATETVDVPWSELEEEEVAPKADPSSTAAGAQNSAADGPLTSLRSAYRGAKYLEMDPTTGLRKTALTAPTPIHKAMQFMEQAEPSFKVKVKHSEIGAEEKAMREAERGRLEMLAEMRVKKKNLVASGEDWIPDIVKEHEKGDQVRKSASELRYEERKKTALSPVSSPQPKQNPWDDAFYNAAPSEVDAGSIGDQSQTVRVWEQKLASGDAALFPKPPPETKQTEKSLEDLKNFKSEVEEKSIADLASTRSQWEQKVLEMEEQQQRLNSSNNSINNNIYGLIKSPQQQPADLESAIEREIRLEQEREKDTREQQKRVREELPEVLNKDTRDPVQSYQEMTEADRNELMGKNESIIEREILAQQEKEKNFSTRTLENKEFEQSEVERLEKEDERFAHESIVDKEIRLQREREQELKRQRHFESPTSGFPRSQSEPVSVRAPAADKVHRFLPTAPQQSLATPPPQHPPKPASPAITVEPPVAMAKKPSVDSVSYEDAISTHAHPGESIIARELREQREREEELRAVYLQRGVHLSLSVEDDLSLAVQTSAVAAAPSYDRASTSNHNASPSNHSNTPSNHAEPTSPLLLGSDERRGSQDSLSSSRDSEGGARDHAVFKVTPMLEDLREERSYRYEPMNESPIDREIRLARERENELRAAKGLPRVDETDSAPPPAPAQPRDSEDTPRRPHPPLDDKQSRKKFATSRLQSEIEREKQRELDLRGQGRISTTSDERTERRNYRDMLPEEERMARGNTPRGNTSRGNTPRGNTPRGNTESRATPQQVAPESPPATATPPPAAPPAAPKPSESTEFYERKQLRKKQNTRETKIEREMREMVEREEELRQLRQVVDSPASPAPSPAPAPAPALANGQLESSPDSNPRPSLPESVSMPDLRENRLCANSGAAGDGRKPLRKKSALAQEWERKFGAPS